MAGAPISCQDATGTADLRRVVGLADLCELLAITFAFPADDGLAAALASGTYLSDATGCLADAGYPASQVQDACRKLETFVGRDVTELAQDLRRGHSLLFLSPGSQGPVWPYEGAFRFDATGTAEAPSLFRSPVTLQVEKAMGEAGLLRPRRVPNPSTASGESWGFSPSSMGIRPKRQFRRLPWRRVPRTTSPPHGPPVLPHSPDSTSSRGCPTLWSAPVAGPKPAAFPMAPSTPQFCPVWGRGGAGADSCN